MDGGDGIVPLQTVGPAVLQPGGLGQPRGLKTHIPPLATNSSPHVGTMMTCTPDRTARQSCLGHTMADVQLHAARVPLTSPLISQVWQWRKRCRWRWRHSSLWLRLLCLQVGQLACILFECCLVAAFEYYGFSLHWHLSLHQYPVLNFVAFVIWCAWAVDAQVVHQQRGPVRHRRRTRPPTGTAPGGSAVKEDARAVLDLVVQGLSANDIGKYRIQEREVHARLYGQIESLLNVMDQRRAQHYFRLGEKREKRLDQLERERYARTAENSRINSSDHGKSQHSQTRELDDPSDVLRSNLSKLQADHSELVFYISSRQCHGTVNLSVDASNEEAKDKAAKAVYSNHPDAVKWLGSCQIFDKVESGAAPSGYSFITANTSQGTPVVVIAASDRTLVGCELFQESHLSMACMTVLAFDTASQLQSFQSDPKKFHVDFQPDGGPYVEDGVLLEVALTIVHSEVDQSGAVGVVDCLAQIELSDHFILMPASSSPGGEQDHANTRIKRYHLHIYRRQEITHAITEIFAAVRKTFLSAGPGSDQALSGDAILQMRALITKAPDPRPLRAPQRDLGMSTLIFLSPNDEWGPGRRTVFAETAAAVRAQAAPPAHEATMEVSPQTPILGSEFTGCQNSPRPKVLWYPIVDAVAMLSERGTNPSVLSLVGAQLANF